MSEFAGRCVIVTGAGRGIGRGIAEAFAAEGAHVLLGARTLSFAEQARAAIVSAGGRAEVCGLDVKNHQSCRDLVTTAVALFGRVDVVVHCAAEIAHGGLGAVSDEAMEAGFASIAKAAWWLLDAARPQLAAAPQGGRFIAIGSVNGTFVTVPHMTAYGMAKAALDAFVRGAAGDVVRENITVNAISPGLVASDNALRVLGPEGLAAYGATIPVGRAGTPADVAHACFYFASEKAGYCTGTTLKLDGGASVALRGEGGEDDVLQVRLKAQQHVLPEPD
ncbi:SDR family NAD(P)-dependent oxidoreductase [Novosphingobium sp. FKTRR1]|uniref:SDR family NAD(P)-dependent oxidoreductase n=1 Tax=Novosphingobium sp. FKTRR1 TaxID=2879118 RepID=UPI001CF0822D|nr:SDR family oxidoreductase [Novosphingobium sp. FKTRR1]